MEDTLDLLKKEAYRVSEELQEHDVNSEAAEKLTERVIKLVETQQKMMVERTKSAAEINNCDAVDRKTKMELMKFAIGAGLTLLEICILLRFEETGSLRSKIWQFIPKFDKK